MEDFILNILNNIDLRLEGPLKFRIILQPLMSLFFAIKAGIRDSKTGAEPFAENIIKNKPGRKAVFKEIWKDVGKVFILAIVLDIVFQIIVLKTVHPVGAIMTAIILAIIPYLIFRGITTRIFNFIQKRKQSN